MDGQQLKLGAAIWFLGKKLCCERNDWGSKRLGSQKSSVLRDNQSPSALIVDYHHGCFVHCNSLGVSF
jgi:hypothetical protein